MRKTLVAFVAALALTPAALLLLPSEAAACSCMMPKDAVTSARDADYVFEGKLVEVESPPPKQPHDLPMKIYTFEVVRTFKGQLDKQVNVHTANNSAACGREYGQPGEGWLIYARKDDQGAIHDNLCSRTMPIADAADDIAQLEANAGTLDQPNPEPEPPSDPGPADPEPNPFEPKPEPTPDASEGPEPAKPGKKGCSVSDDSGLGGLAALLGLGLLGLRRRPH